MNQQDKKDAMKTIIPLIRGVVPKKVAVDITETKPEYAITKEDIWKMCVAIDVGKKYGFIKPKR